MVCWLIMVSFIGLDEQPQTGVPNLEAIFSQHQVSEWKNLLPKKGRVLLDLRPLLHDFGYLSSDQIAIGFGKLVRRYRVISAEIHNSQSDTNYGWLDIYLQARLLDRNTGNSYRVIFSIQFKITASRWTINQWFVQDIF